jgi:flagellar biosynthesis protein FlhA
VRKALAAELGIVLPKVRLRDNLALGDDEYQFRINNVAVARGTIEEDAVLAVPRSSHAASIAGNPTTDQETGKPSLWIKTANSRAAREAGYRVMGAAAVIAVHFHRCAVRHAADLLTRDATASLIRELKKTAPTAVDDLVPKVLSLGQIQQVLQRLLAEGVSIRPLALILETLGNHAPRTSDIVELVEKVRQRMAATIMTRYRDARGKLRVVRLDPTIESLIAHHSDWRDGELVVSLEERQRSSFFGLVRQRCQSLVAAGEAPILLVGAKVRPAVKRLVETDFPDLVVLSDREVTRDTHLESLAVIGA